MPAKTQVNLYSEGNMQKTTSESDVKAHTVSSNIRQTGNRLSIFEGSTKEPLKYDKYIVGRSCTSYLLVY